MGEGLGSLVSVRGGSFEYLGLFRLFLLILDIKVFFRRFNVICIYV